MCSRRLADARRTLVPPPRRSRGAASSRSTPDLLDGHHRGRPACRAFVRAMAPRPVPTVDLDHVAPIRLSVAEAVDELVDELPRAGRITFRRLTGGLVERLEVIVRFLASWSCSSRAWWSSSRPRPSATSRSGGSAARRLGDAGPWRRRRRLRGLSMSARRSSTAFASTGRRARRAAARTPATSYGPSRPSCSWRPSRCRRTCWPSSWSSPWSPSSSSAPRLAARVRGGGARVRRWCASPAATATRAIRIWPPTSSASCWRASRPACRRPRWRPWPSWPTSSPSPGRRSRPIRGVDPDAVLRTLQSRGYVDQVGRDPGSGPGRAVGHDPALPRAAGPRLGGRPASHRRLRPRSRGGRGTGGRPAAGARRATLLGPTVDDGAGSSRRADGSPSSRGRLRRGSACRRCWRNGGTAAAGCARTSSPPAGSGQRAAGEAGPAGGSRPRPGGGRRSPRCPSNPGSCTTC